MSLKIEFDINSYLTRIWNIIRRFNIGHLLILAFGLHMFAIASTPDSMIFDEVYYTAASRATRLLQPANLEHTPLAKIMGAVSMNIFGDWWFAWRFPIVITAMICLVFFYLLAKRFMPEKYALIATAFLMFDTMFFVHGSIFVLDMPTICFGVVGVELYFAKHYKWSAAALGVSFLMKELGLFFMFTVVLYHIFAHFRIERKTVTIVQERELVGAVSGKSLGTEPKQVEKKVWRVKSVSRPALKTMIVACFVFLLVSGGGLWVYDIVYKPNINPLVVNNVHVSVLTDPNGTALNTTTYTDVSTVWAYITNPIEHLQWEWHYFTSLVPAVVTPDVDYRPPWGWIMPWGNVFNSPKYLVVAVSVGPITHITLNWISQINPLIAYAFIPLLALFIFDFIRRKGQSMDYLCLIWSLVAYVPWLLDGLFWQRMTFNYYFLYTIPAICLGIGWAYSRIRIEPSLKRTIIASHLLAVIVFFLYFFPLSFFR